MEDKNKKIITLLLVFTIIFTVIGSSFAYLRWQTSTGQQTDVTFTVANEFSCGADGGNELNSSSVLLEPTTCDDSVSAIKREITLKPVLDTTGISIYMDVWLDVVSLDDGLKNSDNFKWVLSNSPTSCSGSSVKSSGKFKGKVKDDKVLILEGVTYTSTVNDKYYLYIWLDKEETSTSTMNQKFEFKLNGECGIVEQSGSEPSTPVLDNGLIPVILSDDATNGYKVIATTSNDSNWYDYDNKKWANAVLVKETGVKTRIQNKASGTEIDPNDILAYFVWIPRYKYKIEDYVKCSEIKDLTQENYPDCYTLPYTMTDSDKSLAITWWKDFISSNSGMEYTQKEAENDITNFLNTGNAYIEILGEEFPFETFVIAYNELNETPLRYSSTISGSVRLFGEKTIDIVFEDNSVTKSLGNSVSTYRTHPAFTFGSEELDGIWVGKFETTGDVSTPTVLPNSIPLISQNVSTQFQTALKFAGGTLSNGTVSFNTTNLYGIGSTLESHMMKNREWGAVAYLSHSKYGLCKNGKCEEIRINNYYNAGDYKTGCGALESNSDSSNVCSNAYASGITAYPQSTTGNITGVFDMSGGTPEYVMGVFANSEGKLWSGYSTSSNSGFNGLVGSSGTEYTSGIPFPTDTKYYDKYQASSGTIINNGTACEGEICYGHALTETTSWYEDFADFVVAYNPWFVRGGSNINGSNAGAFSFDRHNGYSLSNNGFRSVLAP